jgi:hypothetical protein
VPLPAGTILFPAERRTKTFMHTKAGMLMLLIKVSRVKESAKLANKHDVAINYEVGISVNRLPRKSI